jgi:hypothetical protein
VVAAAPQGIEVARCTVERVMESLGPFGDWSSRAVEHHDGGSGRGDLYDKILLSGIGNMTRTRPMGKF